MRLTKPLVGLSVAGLFALAACGGSDSAGPDSTIDLDGTGAAGQDPTAQGPFTVDGAVEGGTVNIINASGSLSTSFDPRNIYYSDTISVFTGLITRSLTQFKTDPETGDQTLVPDLATDLGTSNDDFTQWTFTLKDGLMYENGDPITSQDIAFTVSSSLDCDTFTDCPSNYLLGTLIGSDKLKSGAPDPDYVSGKKIVSGLETPDDKTLIFNFSQPFPDLPAYAFFPLFSPMPSDDPELTSPEDYENNILASGPYKIDSWSPGKSLVLSRNDQWDAATDPARTQYPDGYDFDTTYSDPKKVDAILAESRGDGANSLTYDELDASDLSSFPADQKVEGPQPLTRWLAPDYSKVPKEVREAITWAYPYAAAAKTAGSIVGTNYIFTSNIMAPGTPGREVYNPIPDHEPGTTDAAKAKAILEESGNLGFELSWLYSTDDPLSVDVKDVVSEAYEAAGFKVKPYATTTTQFTTDRSNPETPINVISGAWLSDWPSGYSWIPPVYNPADPTLPCADQTWPSFGVVNYARFCEDDVVEQIKETQALPLEDQPAAWQQLEQYIQETYYPLIPLANGGTVQGHGTAIQGHLIDPTGGMPTWKIISIAQ